MNEPNTQEQIPLQIQKWTCHKLECFSDYIEAYTKTLDNSSCCYLELFAGCGSCSCRDTDCVVSDSALRALKTKTRFSRYIFVVNNQQNAENLKRLASPLSAGSKVEIITGSPINDKVMRQVFDLIPRSSASLALVDPPGYRKLRWSSIKKLAVHGNDWKGHKIELLIILPLEMALLRNLSRPECEASINRLFGNRKWHLIRQERLEDKIKAGEARKKLVELFKAGLKGLGYRYVDDLRPTGLTNQPYYHLIRASDRAGSAKMLADAWSKERYLPCEMFHRQKGEK